jgi:hypothetical protein
VHTHPVKVEIIYFSPSKIRFEFWLIYHCFLSCLENSFALSHISELHTLLRKLSHTHTHCMSWVIYLKFLSTGKFVLIEFLTLNYIFAYFWIAIWLLYQSIMHACFEDIFREKYSSANFPQVSDFQCEASGRSSSWSVRVRLSGPDGSDTSEWARFCQVLI